MPFSDGLRQRVKAAMDDASSLSHSRFWSDGAFEYTIVGTPAQAEELLGDFPDRGAERWPLDLWIDRALEPGRDAILLSLRRTGSACAEAFGVWRSRGSSPEAIGTGTLEVALDAAYVAPGARGFGLSDALGRSFVSMTLANAVSMARTAAGGGLEIVFDGQAHSAGGASMATAVSAGLADGVADMDGAASYRDAFDYREFEATARSEVSAPSMRLG